MRLSPPLSVAPFPAQPNPTQPYPSYNVKEGKKKETKKPTKDQGYGITYHVKKRNSLIGFLQPGR